MEIVKVLNDGKHLKQSNGIISFLTDNGWRTPKYIYVGMSEGNIEMAQMTKKGCVAAIERDNRLFGKENCGR